MANRRMPRVTRLITLGILLMVILMLSQLGLSWLIHSELMATYQHNYEALAALGFTDVLTSAEVVSDRILLLIIFFPILGAGFVFPILLVAALDIIKLSKEHPEL